VRARNFMQGLDHRAEMAEKGAMQFLPDPGSPATKPPRDARIWQLALFMCV
jgi:hypothetical protein